MYKTGEIYSVFEQFEKITTGRFDKEDKSLWQKKQWYQDGNINSAFKMYIEGYSAGKCAQRLGLFE